MGVDLKGFFIFAVVVGAAVGALVFWLVPIIWAWVKPIVHAVTA